MLILLRTLFWGLLAFWLWRRIRRWVSPPAIRRSDPRRPARPGASRQDDPPLTNQPIEDADYEELP